MSKLLKSWNRPELLWLVAAIGIAAGIGWQMGWQAAVDRLAAAYASTMTLASDVILFEIAGVPVLVMWVFAGGIFFTLRFGWINLRGFKHALEIAFGNESEEDGEDGEVSHFQALATALSGTVGMGNIAGVALAIGVGGPGASLWMTLAGFFGMSSKFVECTLGQKYRRVRIDGTVVGGPMYYIAGGLAARGRARLGRWLAAAFALCAIASSLSSTTLFQANQSFVAIAEVWPWLGDRAWLYGIVLSGLVALVVVGGVRRIAAVASTIVPLLCGLYVLGALWVVASNAAALPDAIATIVREALTPEAMGGGALGAMVQGLRRSAFSNEAGLGTASIAHSAAKTQSPVREGLVSLLEPFIDTVAICNLTALVLVVTGVYTSESAMGSALTSAAFGSAVGWFPIVLAISLACFGYSTTISCAYYGEVCWTYLWGDRSRNVFKVLFLGAVFVGAIANPAVVMHSGDALFLTLAVPNLIATFWLSGEVAEDLEAYARRYFPRLGSSVPQPYAEEPPSGAPHFPFPASRKLETLGHLGEKRYGRSQSFRSSWE